MELHAGSLGRAAENENLIKSVFTSILDNDRLKRHQQLFTLYKERDKLRPTGPEVFGGPSLRLGAANSYHRHHGQHCGERERGFYEREHRRREAFRP